MQTLRQYTQHKYTRNNQLQEVRTENANVKDNLQQNEENADVKAFLSV